MLVRVPLLGLRLYELAQAVAVPGEATRLNTSEDNLGHIRGNNVVDIGI